MKNPFARLFRRAEKESSGTASPALWFVNGGSGAGATTIAGVGVNAGSALRCGAVYACVRVVSEDVAKLPLVIYRRGPNGGKIPADKHPLYRLLKSRPNSWQSSFEWREMMQAHVELRGNAYSFIVRDQGGRVQELLPLHPDRVTLLRAPDGELFYRISSGPNDPEVPMTVPRTEVLHLRGMSLDGYFGLSPIAWARETIGLTLAAELHGAAYFGNGARPDIVLSSVAPITPEAAKAIRDNWERQYGGTRGAHRPAVLPYDMKIEKLNITNKDSQFLELRQFQVADVARIFRLPPHKIMDLSRATFTNIEQQSLDYYLDGLMPRLERFEAAMMRDLLSAEEQQDFEIEFDFTRILRGDLKTTMEAIASGRNWGIINANEGRRWLNLPPRKDGEQFLEPLNMAPAGTQPQAGQSQLATEAPAPDAGTPSRLAILPSRWN